MPDAIPLQRFDMTVPEGPDALTAAAQAAAALIEDAAPAAAPQGPTEATQEEIAEDELAFDPDLATLALQTPAFATFLAQVQSEGMYEEQMRIYHPTFLQRSRRWHLLARLSEWLENA